MQTTRHRCLNALTLLHIKSVSGTNSPKKQRTAAHKKEPPPLTKAQIRDIVHKISTGAIKLPDLPDMRDQDLVTVWALLDAGSAVNDVDFEKHFPGIKVN